MEGDPLVVQRWELSYRRRQEGAQLHQIEYPKDSHLYSVQRDKRRYASCGLLRLLLICSICVTFLLLFYIPVYTDVTAQPAFVIGWTVETNRDTKVYIQPGNTTLVHDIKNICEPSKKEPLFLLIIVCSSTANFKARQIIRETWGNYSNFIAMSKAWDTAKDKYKDYKFNYDLELYHENNLTVSDGANNVVNKALNRSLKYATVSLKRTGNINKKSDISVNEEFKDLDTRVQLADLKESQHRFDNINRLERLNGVQYQESKSNLESKVRNKRKASNVQQIFPHLVAALVETDNTIDNEKRKNTIEEEQEEVRFPESAEQKQSEFDINKVMDEESEELELIPDEESNVMKIPPRGYEESPDLYKVLALLKKTDIFKSKERAAVSDDNNVNVPDSNKPLFKVVFILGLPSGDNNTKIQDSIDEESARFGDIIQEDFVDSYNNLTLKSVMMLKWFVTHCDEKARYLMKADDDIFVNVPRLISTIHERSSRLKVEGNDKPEYYVAGSLIRNARPVTNNKSKWYSPRYMYAGKIYPRYLSGTGYLMTSAAAMSLYAAALRMPLFHLEDVFITGMCSARAVPRLQPQPTEGFAFSSHRWTPCDAYSRHTVHRVSAQNVRNAVATLADAAQAERCERGMLQKNRLDMLKKSTKLSVLGLRSKVVPSLQTS